MARRLIRQEGLLVGGSSGSAMWAAVEVAKKVGPNKRIVTLLPDSVRNYMTKFLDDQWMRENGFTDTAWRTTTIGELLRRAPARDLVTTSPGDTLADAVMSMKESGVSQLPVTDDGRLVGIVTESDLLARLVEGNATLASAVADRHGLHVAEHDLGDDVESLTALFAHGYVGLIVDEKNSPVGILTKMDLVDHLARKSEHDMVEAAL